MAGASDELLNKPITAPFGMEMPVFAIAQIAVSHVWYHDGQLNYIQSLLGDDKKFTGWATKLAAQLSIGTPQDVDLGGVFLARVVVLCLHEPPEITGEHRWLQKHIGTWELNRSWMRNVKST
ncbi:MAG: hypothetical protein R2688_02665 [Fimbriimonadaceae bacterium]